HHASDAAHHQHHGHHPAADHHDHPDDDHHQAADHHDHHHEPADHDDIDHHDADHHLHDDDHARGVGNLQQPDRDPGPGGNLWRHDERHELAVRQLRQLGKLARAGLPVDAGGLGHGDHRDVRRRHELRHRPLPAQRGVRGR